MSHYFEDRLERLLNEADFPADLRQRNKIFAKMFKIGTELSQNILLGKKRPTGDILYSIANEFEVSPEWLLGK
jgi:hypothetical protein